MPVSLAILQYLEISGHTSQKWLGEESAWSVIGGVLLFKLRRDWKEFVCDVLTITNVSFGYFLYSNESSIKQSEWAKTDL